MLLSCVAANKTRIIVKSGNLIRLHRSNLLLVVSALAPACLSADVVPTLPQDHLDGTRGSIVIATSFYITLPSRESKGPQESQLLFNDLFTIPAV